MGASLAAASLLLISSAHADDRSPGGDQNGGGSGGKTDDGKITATAIGVQYDTSKNGTGKGTGPVTPVGDWTPPACWYAPKYTPQEAARTWMGYDRSPNHSGADTVDWFKDRYIKGNPYTDFNVDKEGKGYWWDAYSDESRAGGAGAAECTDPPFWVDIGTPPPTVKNVVTPEILAELAYAQIRIPQGKASTNPDGTLTVNLPTWTWLDKTTFHPVSVRAYVKVLGIEATTTATPVSLHIDAGTQDATVFPAGGDCPIDAHGNLGAPYVKGDTGDPPCGVTYLRSTETTGPYQFKATVTWNISWTGTGQPRAKRLADGTYGTPQDANVREIQTVNR